MIWVHWTAGRIEYFQMLCGVYETTIESIQSSTVINVFDADGHGPGPIVGSHGPGHLSPRAG